jgi:hypothetical protein
MSYHLGSRIGIEQNEWLRSLTFYEEELKILQGRLAEVANRNTKQEPMAGVEHFQNQFMIQRKNIQDLKHKLKAEHHELSMDAQAHMGRVEDKLFDIHEERAEDIRVFGNIFNGLRHEFNQFLVRWM